MGHRGPNTLVSVTMPSIRRLLIFIACCHQAAHAQPLRPESFARTFTSIRSVRELSNGHVLVADSREREVMLLKNLQDDGMRLGRPGQGPGEYQSPRALVGLAGDTTIIVDKQSGRLLKVHDLRFVSTTPYQPGSWPVAMVRIVGTTTSGDIWGLRGFRSAARARETPLSVEPSSADSVLLLRFDGVKQVLDTVRRLKGGASQMRMVKKNVLGNPIWYQLVSQITDEDQVSVCDNDVALIGRATATVEIVSRDGKRLSQFSLDHTPRPTTQGVRRQLIREEFGTRVAASFTEADYPPSPNTLPVFRSSGFECVGAKRLVRLGYAELGGTADLEVYDFSGRRLARTTVPAGSVIVGRGKNTVYLSVPDEDDLLQLRRYSVVTPS
jgi:hypothetical protein